MSHFGYTRAVSEIPLRELRNDTSAVLRRVEDGESFTVTVSGRPVAQIVPLQRRRPYLTWDEIAAAQADAGLVDDLSRAIPEAEVDILDPWERAGRRRR